MPEISARSLLRWFEVDIPSDFSEADSLAILEYADQNERSAITRHDERGIRPLLRAIEAVGLQPALDELWERIYGRRNVA